MPKPIEITVTQKHLDEAKRRAELRGPLLDNFTTASGICKNCPVALAVREKLHRSVWVTSASEITVERGKLDSLYEVAGTTTEQNRVNNLILAATLYDPARRKAIKPMKFKIQRVEQS